MEIVAAIGSFDGVHLGHQALLRRVVERASELGVRPAAITFSPHPRSVLRPQSPFRYLMTLEDRLATLREIGIQDTRVMRFDEQLAGLTAREFFELVGRDFETRALVVGENFRIGRGREAGVPELERLGLELGWQVIPVPPVYADGDVVSSSRIRGSLEQEGDVRLAARLLGRPHTLVGAVVRGAGRGRTIGIPTANLQIDRSQLVPSNGVYRCSLVTPQVSSEPLSAVVNIGIRPTFDAGERTVEAHVLDWTGDLYGQQARLWFHDRIRGERKFDGVESLVHQIRADIDEARRLASTR